MEPLSPNYLGLFLCCVEVDDERNDLSPGNYNDIKREMPVSQSVSHLTNNQKPVFGKTILALIYLGVSKKARSDQQQQRNEGIRTSGLKRRDL